MLWAPRIPKHSLRDAAGRAITLTTVAGAYSGVPVASPPPHSWAADTDHEVAIWSIKLEAGAEWEIPAASASAQRRLYFFEGKEISVRGTTVTVGRQIDVKAGVPLQLVNGNVESEVLMLQGRPIAEPVAKHGPCALPLSIPRGYHCHRPRPCMTLHVQHHDIDLEAAGCVEDACSGGGALTAA